MRCRPVLSVGSILISIQRGVKPSLMTDVGDLHHWHTGFLAGWRAAKVQGEQLRAEVGQGITGRHLKSGGQIGGLGTVARHISLGGLLAGGVPDAEADPLCSIGKWPGVKIVRDGGDAETDRRDGPVPDEISPVQTFPSSQAFASRGNNCPESIPH